MSALLLPKIEDHTVFDIVYSQHPEAARADVRKQSPVATGFLDYFPLAVLEVARCSAVGNEQHHPGAPLHWDRAKSADEVDALVRHLMERGTMDSDGIRHTTKVAWRAMALLQKELEDARTPPVAPAPRYSQRPLDAHGNVR